MRETERENDVQAQPIFSVAQEEEETKPQLAKNDPREIQMYYQNFYEKNIAEGLHTKKP